MGFVDLHTHSNKSDGGDSPAALVALAARLSLDALALTDHDTVAGLDEAFTAGLELGVEVIRGCELAVRSEYGEVHLLGLWLPERPKRLMAALETVRQKRHARNQAILGRLKNLGVDLDYEELRDFAGGPSVGRPHLANFLLRKGYVSSYKDAFIRYLGAGAPAYVPRSVLNPEEGMELFTAEGASVVLAHPMLIKAPLPWLDVLAARLKGLGLCAVEAYHSEHGPEETKTAEDLAARHGLLLSGGSDYHGAGKPAIKLGQGHGFLRVPSSILDKLKADRRAKNLPV